LESSVCPLCSSYSALFYKKDETYYRCSSCYSIFEDEKDRPDIVSERERYELHDNNVEDLGYQKFVSPITSHILEDFDKESLGLDFGAGTGPVLSKVLLDHDYVIKQYDPFFHNDLKLLEKKYDYIASCEVIEHFYNPYKEFSLLKNMMKSGSKLYLMTELYSNKIDFSSWYYKNDPTHVFFYTKETFNWIKEEFCFNDLKIDKRLIVLTN